MNPASAMYKIIYARNARNPLYYTLPSKLCNTWILNIRIWITFMPCFRGENLSLIIIWKFYPHLTLLLSYTIQKSKSHRFLKKIISPHLFQIFCFAEKVDRFLKNYRIIYLYSQNPFVNKETSATPFWLIS